MAAGSLALLMCSPGILMIHFGIQDVTVVYDLAVVWLFVVSFCSELTNLVNPIPVWLGLSRVLMIP